MSKSPNRESNGHLFKMTSGWNQSGDDDWDQDDKDGEWSMSSWSQDHPD